MKISLSWYGKVAERAMTWGGSSLPCSAQVKVKSLQSLGRIPQPLGSYSTTHGGHSWQSEFLLKGPAGCLQFTKDSTASCCGERNTAPTSHALVTFWEVIDSWKVRLGKDLERDELGHIAEGNKVLFRDGTKTTDTNLDEPGQSVGIFLKIFAPVLCVSQTYWIRNWGRARGTENSRPLWFWCVLTFGNQWFSWKAFISEFRIIRFRKISSLLEITKWLVTSVSTWWCSVFFPCSVPNTDLPSGCFSCLGLSLSEGCQFCHGNRFCFSEPHYPHL